MVEGMFRTVNMRGDDMNVAGEPQSYGVTSKEVFCSNCRWVKVNMFDSSIIYCTPIKKTKHIDPIVGHTIKKIKQSPHPCSYRNKDFDCSFYEKRPWYRF